MKHIHFLQIILYVSDQQKSTQFYEQLFRQDSDMNVPGMTEFRLAGNCKLGLMPNQGIAHILGDKTPHPDSGNGIPRCELYLYVEDVQLEYDHAIRCGAVSISPVEARDWGDIACYFSDPDGHIIAFASKL